MLSTRRSPLLLPPRELWTPDRISGLQGWYAADAITGLADGAGIAQWNDLSGLGNHLTQATGGNQPLYKNDAWAGKPSVRFDGASSWMANDAGLSPTFNGTDLPMAFFAVVNTFASSGTQYMLFGGRLSSAIPNYGYRIWPSWQFAKRDNSSTTVSLTPSPSPNVLNKPFVLGHNYSGTVMDHTLDGRYSTTAADNGIITIDRVTVGAARTTGAASSFLNGDMPEVIIYNRYLDPWERGAVERYLQRKWKVPAR